MLHSSHGCNLECTKKIMQGFFGFFLAYVCMCVFVCGFFFFFPFLQVRFKASLTATKHVGAGMHLSEIEFRTFILELLVCKPAASVEKGTSLAQDS